MTRLSEVRTYGIFIGNRWVNAELSSVEGKFMDEVVGWIGQATRDHVRFAVDTASAAFEETPLPPEGRYRVLHDVASVLRQKQEEFARIMVAETGFTWRDVRSFISRAHETLPISADEAKRIGGEVIPIQAAPRFENAPAFTIRVPVGVICRSQLGDSRGGYDACRIHRSTRVQGPEV